MTAAVVSHYERVPYPSEVYPHEWDGDVGYAGVPGQLWERIGEQHA